MDIDILPVKAFILIMFEVLKEELLKIQVFRDGTPCRMVNIHHSTWRDIPEDLQYCDYFSVGVATTEHLHPGLSCLTGNQETGLHIRRGWANLLSWLKFITHFKERLKLYYETYHEPSSVSLLLFTSHNVPLKILHLKQFFHLIQRH